MQFITRQAAALALAAFALPIVSGCDLQKSSGPIGPMNVAVKGSPHPEAPTPAAVTGNRAPDPRGGERLPLPDMSGVVARVAAEHPDALRASCGNWDFMDRVVDELRRHDTRWGYNWKRGNVGDPSHDVVDYHWGAGPDEGSTEVYIIDIIGGHCGDNPSPSWGDVTDLTYHHGSIGRWTGRGRF